MLTTDNNLASVGEAAEDIKLKNETEVTTEVKDTSGAQAPPITVTVEEDVEE